jgi:hypothetical protein
MHESVLHTAIPQEERRAMDAKRAFFGMIASKLSLVLRKSLRADVE